MSLTNKRKSKGPRTEPLGPQSYPVVTQECSHIDLHVYCRSHPRSNLYKVGSFNSGMTGNRVRKIRPVVNKIQSFVLLRSIIIKKHLLRNTETQKTKALNNAGRSMGCAFLWDDPDQDQWSEITWIMVDQMNRWIHSEQELYTISFVLNVIIFVLELM